MKREERAICREHARKSACCLFLDRMGFFEDFPGLLLFIFGTYLLFRGFFRRMEKWFTMREIAGIMGK